MIDRIEDGKTDNMALARPIHLCRLQPSGMNHSWSIGCPRLRHVAAPTCSSTAIYSREVVTYSSNTLCNKHK